jgi:NTE family protein
LNPVPVDAARQFGAARVIAVDLAADEPLLTSDMLQQGRRDALFFRFISTTEQQKLFRVAVRSIGIMCQQIRLAKAERCPPEVTIHPEVEKVGLVDFDLAEVALAAGETAARAALPQIVRLMTPSARERLRGGWRKITRRRGESAARNQ